MIAPPTKQARERERRWQKQSLDMFEFYLVVGYFYWFLVVSSFLGVLVSAILYSFHYDHHIAITVMEDMASGILLLFKIQGDEIEIRIKPVKKRGDTPTKFPASHVGGMPM